MKQRHVVVVAYVRRGMRGKDVGMDNRVTGDDPVAEGNFMLLRWVDRRGQDKSRVKCQWCHLYQQTDDSSNRGSDSF